MTRDDLKKLLSSDVPDIQNKNLWIFGAGNTAVLYYNGLKRLETEGFFIQGYVDNNSAKWGTTFNNRTVISPEELKTLPNICVLVCSIQKNVIVAVQNQLSEMGIINYRIDDVILKKHANEVLQCYDLFCDNDSKNTYAELVKARITGNDDILPYSSKELYYAFKPFLLNSSNEVFIDCGAYVGDSMERYIWNKDGVFHKIYAFEPDPNNFLALQNRKKRLCLEWSGCREDNILTYPYGIAEASLYADVHHHQQTNGLSSHIELLKGEQSGKPNVISLDDFIKEPYHFLKADIEGWEYNMLLGAQKGIRENRPLMTICIYHSGVDFYSIPLLLKSWLPDYSFGLCHHRYTLTDTILYCWPNI